MSKKEDNAITSLVTSVYRDVWEEFYAWDLDYSADSILSLHRDIVPDAVAESSQSQPAKLCNPQSFFSNSFVNSSLLRWEYPKEKIERQGDPVHMIDYKVAHLKAPTMNIFPKYESCTPIIACVFVGDDSDDLPFVPFPGTSFDFVGYQSHHDGFAWQNQWLDPDTKAITLESVRRLDTYHGVPLDTIKEILLPSFPISELGQGDVLQWLHYRMSHDEAPQSSPVPERSDSKARFEGLIHNFCPNLNCIEAFCAVHEKVPPTGPPNYASREDKLQVISGPCGPACFLLTAQSSGEHNNVEVGDAIRNTMTTVLSVCPDLTTCQLAVACARACRETHFIRRKLALLSYEGPVRQGNESDLDATMDNVIEILDHFTLNYEPDLSCHHSGPCNNSTACPCYRNKAYCEKSCRCSRQCIRRFRGCKCKATFYRHSAKTCTSASCPCLNAGRECDPEVCLTCKTRYVHSHPGGNCFNSQIQQRESKRTIVKQGKYGMGLFVDQSIRTGELILEYTGEIIFESTVDSRDFFSLFRGRNYFFKLTKSITIDASNLGNESRFINHDKAKENCRARYCMVNGVLRIGIFATKQINRGTELHMNYGDTFFGKDE